ncbi:DMT family transporter [Desulfobulbus rhabdoformis]|uniref:DMT family transporter n=1 Tax=Desulfobulbus rhabdoformis TaxID=34032 RepID=UPI001962EA09|nr:DMT family transporter [Desulfobulbus rhabdoformis]MBM9614991.1 DMT family transporter [Desulfobulbus rhabdoformis]
MPYLLLTLTTLFWSGNFVVSRGMHAVIPPVALSFWRWSLALVILLGFAWKPLWRDRRLLWKYKRFILAQGLLGVTGFNTLLYMAMQYTGVINGVLVNSCVPVLIAVISWIRFQETLLVRQYCGIFISLSGVALIMAKGDVSMLTQISFNRGDLLVLAAAVVWALYSTNLRRYPGEIHPLAYLLAMILVGLVGLSPLYLWELAQGKTFTVNSSVLLTVGYVAFFASVLAFIFWNRAVRSIGANRAGPFVHLMPVFSSILAMIFLHEQPERYHAQGVVLIFCGILLSTVRLQRTTTTERSRG